MRKYSVWLGIASMALFLVAGVAVLAIAAKNSFFDNESRDFVETAMPAIFTNWDDRELMLRASPEFRDAVNNGELRRLFSGMAANFGRLKACERLEGGASISMVPDHGIVITGEYQTRSSFEAGQVDIDLSLVKDGGNWQILSFRLDSELFKM